VVDVDERPDLFALCRDKYRIRAFFCPHCHEFSFLYFPLMIFYPTAGRVVFVVDRDWPEDKTREIATELAFWISTGVKPDASKTEWKRMVSEYLDSAIVIDRMALMLGHVPLA
jgi:hypothetical protein